MARWGQCPPRALGLRHRPWPRSQAPALPTCLFATCQHVHLQGQEPGAGAPPPPPSLSGKRWAAPAVPVWLGSLAWLWARPPALGRPRRPLRPWASVASVTIALSSPHSGKNLQTQPEGKQGRGVEETGHSGHRPASLQPRPSGPCRLRVQRPLPLLFCHSRSDRFLGGEGRVGALSLGLWL